MHYSKLILFQNKFNQLKNILVTCFFDAFLALHMLGRIFYLFFTVNSFTGFFYLLGIFWLTCAIYSMGTGLLSEPLYSISRLFIKELTIENYYWLHIMTKREEMIFFFELLSSNYPDSRLFAKEIFWSKSPHEMYFRFNDNFIPHLIMDAYL